jgi:hypothetical protein
MQNVKRVQKDIHSIAPKMRERKRRKTWSGGDSREAFLLATVTSPPSSPSSSPLGQLRGKKAFINLFILSLLPLQAIEQRVQVVA